MTGSADLDLSLAVACYGFIPRSSYVEAAGLFYEARIVRDKLSLGKCTLPVFRNPNAPVVAAEPEQVTKNGRNKGRKSPPVEVAVDDRVELFDADAEKYEKYLMKLDPNDCKSQDHYKVLGLSKLRYKATNSEVRTAYRQKVLKHHPDKKKHKGIALPAGEDYFVCITKAYEQLGMSDAKRKAYDSVDPKFDEEIPTDKEVNKKNFFDKLTPVFERNARFANVQPAPLLGNMESPRSDVEDFYDFWFSWNSWREFSYLDEEDKERGEDRYERREMEKANKIERERRRKEDMKRIRTLIDIAYNKDPRIVQYKKDDQLAKEQAKEERARLKREKIEAEAREKQEKLDEEKRIKDEAEKKAKQARDEAKRIKDVARKAAQEQKKRFDALAKECNWWSDDNGKLSGMERVDRVTFLLSTDDLSELCSQIEEIKLDNDAVVQLMEEAEKSKTVKPSVKTDKSNKENQTKEVIMWTNEELQLLTKAANLYPAGTIDRWIVIADYVNEHRKDKSTPEKIDRQVIKQVKLVQAGVAKPTASAQNNLGVGAQAPDEDVWSPADQKLLEEAIRTFPASDAERWDKISAFVPGKSKKACIRRFKHLVQLVKDAKK